VIPRLEKKPGVRLSAESLEALFEACFLEEYRTRLQGGAQEPLYQPAGASQGEHVIYYREDFIASALHEVAHWCIAGSRRRQLVDYGYWYFPDGRDASRQRQFEQVESRPQALEWHFALACNWRFRISNDNLAAMPSESTDFAGAVCSQARRYCRTGLPARGALFRSALVERFSGKAQPTAVDFDRAGT
jgi:elongation factor P hydroxylase